jgi:hypothetical protein
VRLRLRLQAESSRNMYSEHGLLALMRAVFGHVCHALMVVSYCTPGSAQPHAASRSSSRDHALEVSTTSPVVRIVVCHSPSAHRAHELVRDAHRVVRVLAADRVVGLAVEVARVARAMRARAFFSSRTFHSMKSTISGWSMSRQTIFAARRVVPPDLVAPAARSKHLEEAHEARARAAARELLLPPAEALKLVPVPEPYLKSRASVFTRS